MKFYFYYTKETKNLSLGVRLKRHTYFIDINNKGVFFEKYLNTIRQKYFDFFGVDVDNVENIFYSCSAQDIEQLKTEFKTYIIK